MAVLGRTIPCQANVWLGKNFRELAGSDKVLPTMNGGRTKSSNTFGSYERAVFLPCKMSTLYVTHELLLTWSLPFTSGLLIYVKTWNDWKVCRQELLNLFFL